MALSTSSNFARPDDAFRAVVEAHRGLSEEQSADLDAALVLILANHIGDIEVLREAIALAKRRLVDGRQQHQHERECSHSLCEPTSDLLKRLVGGTMLAVRRALRSLALLALLTSSACQPAAPPATEPTAVPAAMLSRKPRAAVRSNSSAAFVSAKW